MSENVNKDTDEPKEESEDYENEFDSYGDVEEFIYLC